MNRPQAKIIETLAAMGAPNDVVQEVKGAFDDAEQLGHWLRSYVLPLVMQNALSAQEASDNHNKMNEVIEATVMHPQLRMGCEMAAISAITKGRDDE